ncbi:patatin-like phospholipase family protein [Agrobacterium genomosp. 3]|uniref:patatin-like phospholipase family protein n=1 Tax=Agrobacterium tomkonis TaxID=1183410 RepID=UPI001CD8E5DA|nr:patatin-like phospholipase family protein [Agrobacterium tomkonis]MCA1879285.1 patatin-like phospholipase family protein [Agrobacterium tumefaciens]MCA1894448.1 patatin-like phospholipase family protein [Agrobacterium tomkonis]
MTNPLIAEDIQSLFAAAGAQGDFIQARKLEDTIGLCLSGGGYRAMIYHVGAIIRLNELGFLQRISEIASVSGGSITAGLLALRWQSLRFDERGRANNLDEVFVAPLLRFAGKGIDIRAILYGLIPGCSAADSLVRAYDRHLFAGACLQDITDFPRFTFMSTNLQTGSGWRFAKGYAADYRVGLIDRPVIPLARVVAASSAFPPFLSPVRIDLSREAVQATAGADLHREPFISTAVLSDGGVYDNLGLERIWKRCRTILVSNAGRTIPEVGHPTGRWVGQMFRTLSLIQQQAEHSRRRLLFGMANQGQRQVAYWSIDTALSQYGLLDALPLSSSDVEAVAWLRTRLNHFSVAERQLLLRAGYAGADASLRARGLARNTPAASFDFMSSIAVQNFAEPNGNGQLGSSM